jgi:methyl acetate hydrolase
MRLQKKTTITVTAFVILAGWLGGTGITYTNARPAPAETPGFSESGKAALLAEMSSAVARGDTPGVVSLVVDQNNVLYEGAAGKLDVAREIPMPVNGIFAIASMTKPVTSTAIMMLFEQGKLKLDDPVSKYLDGFDHLEVITKFNEANATYETRPAKGTMTIRQLLTHTSGIGYAFTNPIEKRLTEATKKNEWELPLLCDPGTEWHYSASTRVLGLIVEKITGTPLEDYYQQNIFKPLGMVDTSYAVPAAKQSRVPVQYNRVSGGLEAAKRADIPSTPTSPFRGDGGLNSTVEDYSKFIRMMLNGGRLGSARILSESSVKMMGENNIGSIVVTLQPDADKSRTKPFPLGAGLDKFGLGFQITSPNPQDTKHRSPGSMSWAGIYNTEFWIDPAKHIGGVQMMQVLPFYDDGAIRTLRDFEETVYQNLK